MVTTPLRITGLQMRYTLTHLKSPAEQRFRESCKIAQHNAMDTITRLTNAKLTQMTLARKTTLFVSFLNAYRTKIAEFCEARKNQRPSHPNRQIFAKNRKKRDPKKNEEKIYTKRKSQVKEKNPSDSNRSPTHARNATRVAFPEARCLFATHVDCKRFHILRQLSILS